MRLAVLSHPCFRSVNRRVHVALAARGIAVQLIVPQTLRGEAADPRREGEPEIAFLPLTSESPRTYRFAGAEAVLASFRPDVVMVEADPVSRLAQTIGGWCRRNGAKMTCLSVDNLDFGFWPHLKRTGLRSLPQVTAKTAMNLASRHLVDQVFTISADGTNVFRKRGYKRVTQVPLGFDPALFCDDRAARARLRAKHGIAPDAVVFGYFGRITRQKGIHLIVEALGEIARSEVEPGSWRFLLDHFQSDDAYGRELRDQIERSGLGERVVFFEADHQKIAGYMNAADVVVLASLSSPAFVEQYGRVIPEAMACGALAVVSNSGTPKDLVGDCGVVFTEGDVAALTAVLRGILAEPERYRILRRAGQERAHAGFTIMAQAEIYHRSLQELTGG